LNTKCVYGFSLQGLSEIFLIVRRNQRDIIINVYRSSCKVPVILVSFTETWIYSTNITGIKFLGSLCSGSRVVSCERTDKQTHRQTWQS